MTLDPQRKLWVSLKDFMFGFWKKKHKTSPDALIKIEEKRKLLRIVTARYTDYVSHLQKQQEELIAKSEEHMDAEEWTSANVACKARKINLDLIIQAQELHTMRTNRILLDIKNLENM